MNANQLEIRVNRDDGSIWACRRLNGKPKRIRDITNDVMFALCADLSADGVTQKVEREIRFADGFSCKITVEVVRDEAPETDR